MSDLLYSTFTSTPPPPHSPSTPIHTKLGKYLTLKVDIAEGRDSWHTWAMIFNEGLPKAVIKLRQ